MNDLGKRNPDKLEEMVALWEQYSADNGVLDISLDISGKVSEPGHAVYDTSGPADWSRQ